MENHLSLCKIPELILGKGSIVTLLDYLPRFGENVLLVTGASSFISKAIGEDIIKKIRGTGYTIYFTAIANEPSPWDIDQAVMEHSDSDIDVVVAVGGGSVLDAGKAISAMLPSGDSVRDYLEGVGTKKHNGKKIPFIAVPTTSGTGSESTNNAVIAEIGNNGFKKSLRHGNLVPDIAILDPELMVSCSKEITAYSGLDAFTQLIESYLSVKSNSFTDMIALEGINNIQANFNPAVANGEDVNARMGMAYAAYLSGISLTNAGLGTIHGLAGTIGGKYIIPHGVVCGTLLAAANRKILDELLWEDPDSDSIGKYATLGKIFYENGLEKKEKEYYANYFIDTLDFLVDKYKVPRLKQFGIKKEDFEQIASQTDNKNNPIKLGVDAIIEVLEERY